MEFVGMCNNNNNNNNNNRVFYPGRAFSIISAYSPTCIRICKGQRYGNVVTCKLTAQKELTSIVTDPFLFASTLETGPQQPYESAGIPLPLLLFCS